jgi:hypothetical protein
MQAKTTPKSAIRVGVQVPVGEEQAVRSPLCLEALPVARKCSVVCDGHRWLGRRMWLG